ncbi:Uncharacterized protein SCF082_LOCUS1666 [Durusdinium trenchii]|uniref:Uncharacterized protein n=1 Tax=Durusdinium trenchii TaxID=1381693 RepID=A0ABP0HFR0_9DINO
MGARSRAKATGLGTRETPTETRWLQQRLEASSLQRPSWGLLGQAFPAWLFGEWEVCSRPVAFGEPLGPRFVDENTQAAVREDLAQRVELRWKARYYWEYLDGPGTLELPSGFLLATPALAAEKHGGTVQFRAFNAGEELKAFLKQRRARVVADADPRIRPLQIKVSFPVEEEEEELIRTVSLKLEVPASEW